MTEYWIWSNQHGLWWMPNQRGYTNKLHDAGRYDKYIAQGIVEKCNQFVSDDTYPDEVMIPVTDRFLTRAAQDILQSAEVKTLDELERVRLNRLHGVTFGDVTTDQQVQEAKEK